MNSPSDAQRCIHTNTGHAGTIPFPSALEQADWPGSHLSQEPRDNFDALYLARRGEKDLKLILRREKGRP